MSKIPTFDSLRARPIGRAPVMYKSAQGAPPDAGAPMGQGMGGVTTGRPDEMEAPESADQQKFEQDLSGMAYQFVSDRAPGLLPYMLGFEVVDRADDGSKAVGIYGYKIDGDFYYVPVFFINNQIRGVDLLFSKRTNSFMPLTEEWINYVINRHTVSLGETAPESINGTMEQPDLTFLRAPKNQVGSKTASAEEPMWSLKTAWHVMKCQSEKMASSDPLVKEMFNGVLRAVKGAPMKKSAEARYINGFMRTVGGPEAQISLLKTFRNVKFANAALTFYDNLDAFREDNVRDAYIHRQAMAKKATAKPQIRIVTAEDAVRDDGEGARQILEHGFTIDDARSEEKVSDMVEDTITKDFDRRFSTPTEVGKYAFVMADGKLREGFLLSLTYTAGGDKNMAAVYFPKDKVFAKADPTKMLVETGTESETTSGDYSELFGKASSKDSAEPDSGSFAKGYLFIGKDGRAFGPVRINSVLKDGDETSYIVDTADWDYTVKTEGMGSKPDFGNWDISDRFHDANGYRKNHAWVDGYEPQPCCDCSTCCDRRIRFCEGIAKPTPTSNGIILPDDWKIVECVNLRSHPEYDPNDSEEQRKAKRDAVEKRNGEYRDKYTFGSASCILCEMQSQGYTGLKLASVGPDEFHFHVDGFRQSPRMTYKQAAVTLVTRFGVRPAKAFTALKKAASDGFARYFVVKPTVKQAQGVGVSMPMPTPQEASVDDYTGIPSYAMPYEDRQEGQFTGVPSLPEEGGLTRGIADGSEIQNGMGGGQGGPEGPEDQEIPIDQQAQQLAEQAAQAGQKHVFDQAAIGGLSKVYDTSAVVDSYIPNFMDSLDRLGRVLFLFYWKHDDFNSRYGSDDVVEMEDRLRAVFKQLGDLTLMLKEKAVQTD